MTNKCRKKKKCKDIFNSLLANTFTKILNTESKKKTINICNYNDVAYVNVAVGWNCGR
jgi:hypothetical protein